MTERKTVRRKLPEVLGLVVIIIAPLFISTSQKSNTASQEIATETFVSDRVGQTFVASHDYLAAIELSSWSRGLPTNPSQRVFAQLYSELIDHEPLREVALDAEDLANQIIRIEFKPISHSKGSRYYLVLDLTQASGYYLQGTLFDSYELGKRDVSGYPSSGDLAFTTFYQMPLWCVVFEGLRLFPSIWEPLASAFLVLGVPALFAASLINFLTSIGIVGALSFGSGAALLLTTILGYLSYILGFPIEQDAIILLLTVMFFAGMYLLVFRSKRRRIETPTIFCGFLCWIVMLLIIRMSYLSELVVPSYQDSVKHYLIVEDLLFGLNESRAFHRFGELSSRYYHFGSHFIIAWVTALSNTPILDTMAVTGQLFQVIAPISLFFPIQVITNNNQIAFFAMVIGSLGWSMPAYASNWGKLPAIASIAAMPAILGFMWIAWKSPPRKRVPLWIVVFILSLGEILLHTRSVFILLAVLLSGLWLSLGKKRVAWLHIMGMYAFVASSLALSHEDVILTDLFVITDLLNRYCANGGWVLMLIIIVLTLITWRRHRDLTLGVSIFLIVFILLGIGPIPFLPGGRLIDRPYAEIALFLPLTFLLIIGVHAIREFFLRSDTLLNNLAGQSVALLILLIGIWIGIRSQPLIANSCCQVLSEDDLEVSQWARINIGQDSRTGIASIVWDPNYKVGADGGAWFSALSGHAISMWPFELGPGVKDVYCQYCENGITHLYAGSSQESFNRSQMNEQPSRYEALYIRPKAAIYKVINCGGDD